jgi:hypothetical protein
VSRYAGWENYKGPPEHRVEAATAKVRTRSTAKSCGVPFDRLCALSELPSPVAEYRFHPGRKWRFVAWISAPAIDSPHATQSRRSSAQR